MNIATFSRKVSAVPQQAEDREARVFALFEQCVKKNAHDPDAIVEITYTALDHLDVHPIFIKLLQTPGTSCQHLNYLFFCHILQDVAPEAFPELFRIIAATRYDVFECICTKMALMEWAIREAPDVPALIKSPGSTC